LKLTQDDRLFVVGLIREARRCYNQMSIKLRIFIGLPLSEAEQDEWMSDDKTIIADPGNMTILQGAKRQKACVIQYNGAKTGCRYPLHEAQTVVGREPENLLFVAEPSISRRHAVIHQNGIVFEIEDLGSLNGTFVNDVKVSARTPLRDGDMIRLGTILFKFYAHDSMEAILADKIYRIATIDAGTQIFNKKYLLDTLETEFKFARAYKKPLCVIYYDLDFFKRVNDTYGHGGGDYVLKESANVVKSCIRKDDVLGRYGGEEFVVVLPNTEQKTAVELAERIRATMEAYVFKIEVESSNGGRKIQQHKQTLSLGVSQLAPDMANYEALLESADKKLYFSKQNGRNKVTA
jgi:two-component system cell cycle response regulator